VFVCTIVAMAYICSSCIIKLDWRACLIGLRLSLFL